MDDKLSVSQPSAERKDSSAPTDLTTDRAMNLALRRWVDEMLGQVRHMHGAAPLWTAEERAQAEAQLEIIMARVRREAAGS